MIVRFFATIRDMTGTALQEVAEQPPATLGELIEALAGQYGPAFRRAVLDGERLAPGVIVLVSGRNAVFAGGLAAPLSSDDEISIFPPLGGG